MNNSPRKSRPRNPRAESTQKAGLTVRMYDVGFGDCFLLRIPGLDGKVAKVLFDCGSIKLGTQPMKDVVQLVINDVRPAPDEPARIDVVVATHRHRDHISGFADSAWEEVEVGEVWMPWTEKPELPEARRVREMQSRLAEQLVTRLNARLSAANSQAVKEAMESSLEMALNASSNEEAMHTLQHGFAGRPTRRYLPEKSANTAWFETPLLPGVVVNVLGPPHDTQIFKEMEPPAGQGYLKLIEAGIDSQSDQPKPFGEDWLVSSGDYASAYTLLSNDLPQNDRQSVRTVGLGLDENVAAALDKALNATSLMLVFQIGRTSLLFPGDAQWGTWRLALESQSSRKLLAATTFYKVGHHGSHNATPVEFVEQVLGNGFWAMVSTNSVASWPNVPKPELLNGMAQKPGSKIARSDQPEKAPTPSFSVLPNGSIEACITAVP
jgi:beta-lactamase superfamily II metal-dependent hydrolase